MSLKKKKKKENKITPDLDYKQLHYIFFIIVWKNDAIYFMYFANWSSCLFKSAYIYAYSTKHGVYTLERVSILHC